jgi:hypothetical protein
LPEQYRKPDSKANKYPPLELSGVSAAWGQKGWPQSDLFGLPILDYCHLVYDDIQSVFKVKRRFFASFLIAMTTHLMR